jgi:NTP pyrophosphatase (non-canonical NTP hydrolase)
VNGFNEYQQGALSTAVYPEGTDLVYLPLKLAGEAGEVAEKIGKAVRNGSIVFDNGTVRWRDSIAEHEIGQDLAKEIGDVLWYVAVLSSVLGFPLLRVAQMNLNKLADRSLRSVLIGEGDDR